MHNERVLLLLVVLATAATAVRATAPVPLQSEEKLDARGDVWYARPGERVEVSAWRDEATGRGRLVRGADPAAPATATFHNTYLQEGWAQLNVSTNPLDSDATTAYLAGYAEGSLTAPMMHDYVKNMLEFFFGADMAIPKPLGDFFAKNDAYVRGKVSAEGTTDPYWRNVGLVLQQFDGMVDGFHDHAHGLKHNFTRETFRAAQFGDLLDLIPAVDASKRVDWLNLPTEEAIRQWHLSTHCSGLIKLKADFSDLYFGHSSWFTYAGMMRIWKTYNLTFAGVASPVVTFSSYPATLLSLDDYYLTSAGLAVIETSNSIFNHTVYERVVPTTVLSWVRTIVANRMSASGEEWAETFARENSGTYNNQWMVVNTRLFNSSAPRLANHTLTIVEQIPGYVHSDDFTETLSRGYWPSYNVPVFRDIYEISGYPAMVAKHGNAFSYERCPRANIFRRDAGAVESMDAFRDILRYNEWQTDPLSLGNPGNAIASRFDLDPAHNDAGGAYDSKASSVSLLRSHLGAHAVMGPTSTASGSTQPVFEWTDRFTVPHDGQPNKFAFAWQMYAAY